MPLARYFTFTGSLLLTLLFLADWYFPKLAAAPERPEIDKTIIRLHSAHKWPEATVFDTSLATIVPLEIVAEIPPSAPIAKSTKQAFALALPEVTSIRSDRPPVARKPIQRKRTRTPPTKARQIGSYAMGEWHEAVPAGWPY